MIDPAQPSVSAPSGPASEGTSDRRLLRGERARQAISRHAADVASLEGLDGLSIGRLAADLGLSKSGIQTLFGTKERLQLAAAESARQQFIEAVVLPAKAAPSGTARLRALTERWISYAEAPLFAGGCFWAANLPRFYSERGAVRDALARHRRDWLTLIVDELQQALDLGEIADLDVHLAAFQIDAVLTAANLALRLGDSDAVGNVRSVIDGILAAHADTARPF